MREFNFVTDRIEDISKELGVSNHTGFLQESSRKIKNLLAADSFYIDLYRHSASNAQVKQWGDALIHNAPQGFIINIKDENTAAARYFEQPLSAVAVIACDETLCNSAQLKEKIEFFKPQYKLAVIINFFGQEQLVQEPVRSLGLSIKQVFLQPADCAEKNINELLSLAVPDPAALNKLKKQGFINSIQPLFGALDEVFLAENKAVQTRKLLNTQNVQILRRDEQSMNQMDFMNTIRQVIMKFGQDLDKNLRAKYEDLNKPNTGKFSQVAQQEVNGLNDFRRENLAEKPEKVGVSIEEEYREHFIKAIGENLVTEFKKDEQFVKASVDDLLSKINIQLRQKNIEPVKPEDIELPLPNKKNVITSYCYISRQYAGELVKKGAYEYFIALRDYIGVIMVATGLLAPLNMIASLGDDKESFFHFLKDMNKYIKFSTALIAISLIAYGIYDLRRRIPRKREEEFNKELLKAKELLLSESRRMNSEAARDWCSNILQWVKEIGQNISNQVDKNAKALQSQKMQKMNNERMQQQRQQSSIDMLQRNIQTAERVKDQLAANFRNLVMEMEKI